MNTPTATTGPNPPPTPGPFATNYGEALLFGAMHVTLHGGQLSTIRRSLGKPPQPRQAAGGVSLTRTS